MMAIKNCLVTDWLVVSSVAHAKAISASQLEAIIPICMLEKKNHHLETTNQRDYAG